MNNIPIIVLKEGTDDAQGRGQLLSNINACLAVQDILKTTLGPLGADKLLVDERGQVTISNDGATIMMSIPFVHPATKILVDIARAQDSEVGDGTTSVVVLAAEILKEVKALVEEGIAPYTIIKALRKASQLAIERVQSIAIQIDTLEDDNLIKCAGTAMSSKLIHQNRDYFSRMIVDAVKSLPDLDDSLIGVKKIQGGSITDSILVKGIAFKKTFAYAGFEQQPKSFDDPKIICLNVELELKAEKDNAEIRVGQVADYADIVNAEWDIIFKKLEQIVDSGAKVVLSRLPIGDLATQYFADRNIFCAGRVPGEDLTRTSKAIGAQILSTTSDINASNLGVCKRFEERQIGGERYNFFEGCEGKGVCTMILRGGGEQFIEEVERSVHDAVMIVRRVLKHNKIVAGGGATEMEISKYLRDTARTIPGKQQLVISAFAKALEVIPRQLCENAGFDSTDILNKLRMRHAKNDIWAGVDVMNEDVTDSLEAFVWEPALVKINAISSATEAACLVLSVDETIKNKKSAEPQGGIPMGRGGGAMGRGGMGRGGMRGGMPMR